jgi:hypothetical protein
MTFRLNAFRCLRSLGWAGAILVCLSPSVSRKTPALCLWARTVTVMITQSLQRCRTQPGNTAIRWNPIRRPSSRDESYSCGTAQSVMGILPKGDERRLVSVVRPFRTRLLEPFSGSSAMASSGAGCLSGLSYPSPNDGRL